MRPLPDPEKAKPAILVVDDDPIVTAALKARLGRDFRVIGVNDPHEAVATARREQPDVILCDIKMPGMQGDEVAFELSQDEETAEIPLIYLTSLVDPRETTELDGPFGGHIAISKSASTDELLDVIHDAIG
jgi:putative two-component system response regulator